MLTHLDQPGISTARQEVSAAGPNVQGRALGVETPNDSKRGGPSPASQARSHTLICEEPLSKERNAIERPINKMKTWRGIAVRYRLGPATE